MSRSKKKKMSHSAGITDAGVLEDLMHSNDRKGGDEDAVIKVNIGQNPLAPKKPNQVILHHGGKNLD